MPIHALLRFISRPYGRGGSSANAAVYCETASSYFSAVRALSPRFSSLLRQRDLKSGRGMSHQSYRKGKAGHWLTRNPRRDGFVGLLINDAQYRLGSLWATRCQEGLTTTLLNCNRELVKFPPRDLNQDQCRYIARELGIYQ